METDSLIHFGIDKNEVRQKNGKIKISTKRYNELMRKELFVNYIAALFQHKYSDFSFIAIIENTTPKMRQLLQYMPDYL